MTTDSDAAEARFGAAAAPASLVAAAHPGPALAVTVLASLLAVADGLDPGRVVLVTAAVLAGQLSIGWSNDLVDAARDRAVGRRDKPLATGAVSVGNVRLACGLAVATCLPLSFACGLAAGLTHLVCVGAGWVYNLGAKATVWSWLPYAVAFGALPVFVFLSGTTGSVLPLWVPAAGALLGVGAHLLNVLPDLADDAATGIRGLPHRLGPRWLPVVAVAVLGLATVVVVTGSGVDALAGGAVLLLAAALGVVALTGRGRLPFVAAVGIALVDVALLVAAR